ncbi:MAG: hypothetical protein MJZ11_00785 [Lachnospiraceae bacterium]|nr:hypothetical protein [Lachnospiraceae bacterium]
MSSDKKVEKLNKNRGMNFGLIIFLVIFAYIIAALFNYMTEKHVESYQVKLGALSTNNIFKGVTLRDETIVRASKSGYVNYFARESERVGVGNLVYSLDESGRVAEYLTKDVEQSDLTNKDLTELKTDILSFVNEFEPSNFSNVYDFKYNVEGTVLKLSNANILSDIAKINESGVSSLVDFNYAPTSGYVIYSIDGYEDISLNDMTSELVDYKLYETESKKKQLISNELVAEGDAVYKLSTNEDWSIVIQVESPEKAEELLEEKYIKVKFLKNQDTSWGKVSKFVNEANEAFIMLTFTNSMMTFCTDRFIDIELILDEDNGLKVPNSSIIEKEFFIIPKEYITKGGNSNNSGVLREYYLEDGTKSSEFVQTAIYNETDDEYYLDDLSLRMGDVLIMTDSANTYTLNKKGSLIGVYNINKGYADFKQINILYQNDEYSIIKPNMVYGLSAYDYIVLDASTVNDDELLYD